MARSKFPHGFEPITKKLRERQIIERLKGLHEATRKVIDEKTSAESEGTSEANDNLDSYENLLEHLTSSNLLENASSEVSILLACCIANIFGILSPNIPINNFASLKEVLLFFVRQLTGLSRTNSDLYSRYLYLLECISAFNIFDLALELGDDTSFILKELIKTGFNAIKEKQEDDDRHIQSLIIGQCSQLLQRIDQISNPVIDAIFYFLVPPQKFVNRESYRMAREFILKNQSTLEPYIQMFLNHGISESELPECSLITERSIFSVVFELHEFSPEIIYPIFGSVVSKLKSEDTAIRKEIVKLLGLLFGSQRSRLAEDIPELWNAYMARYNDASEEVRLICVSLSFSILIYHPELRGQVSGLIAARCHDINDAIRLESVTVIRKLALAKFETLNEDLLNCLAGRIRDKKPKVRQEAIRAAAAIHKLVYVGEQFTESERASVAVLMLRILNFYYQPYLDDRLLIEKLFVSSFVPFKLEPERRMKVLFDVFMKFGDVEIRSFEEILSQQFRFRRFAREIFQILNGEHNATAIQSRIQLIAESYSTPAKTAVHFQRVMEFVEEEPRVLQLLQYIFGSEYECDKVESALVEVVQRLKQSKQLSEEAVSLSVGFLERYAPLQFDARAVEKFLSVAVTLLEEELSSNIDKEEKKILKILKLLQIIADNYSPFLYNEKTLKFFERILKFDSSLTEAAVLKILATTFPEDLVCNGDFNQVRDRLVAHFKKCSREGNPRAAKYAVRCIAKMHGKAESIKVLESIVKDSVPCVDLFNHQCATAIKALGSCCTFIPLFVKEQFGELITKKAASVVVGKGEDSCNKTESSFMEKFDYYKLHYGNGISDDCLLRIFGMRLLCDFVMSLNLAKTEEVYVRNLVHRTLKLFERILRSHGELVSSSLSSEEFAGHIRLMAGCCIIKLAAVNAFSSLVTADQLVLLGCLVHDELRFVRRRILGKLTKHLNTIRLPVEYMGLFSLIPLVKEDSEFYSSGVSLLEGCILRRKKFVAKEKAESIAVSPYHKPEYAVAYGLYVLAKQDSFTAPNESSLLREMRECLWFLIGAFHRKADARSLAEITTILEHIKLMSDANMTHIGENSRLEQNEKIWALADVGLLMLSYRIPPISIKSYFKPRLSKRFYVAGPSEKGKVYVPADIVEEEQKLTVRRKRNISGSSTLKTIAEKSISKTTIFRDLVAKRSSKNDIKFAKQGECGFLDDVPEEFANGTEVKLDGVQHAEAMSGKPQKATTKQQLRFDLHSDATRLGFEEEAPSRSPSQSSFEDGIGREPSTSHDALSSNNCLTGNGSVVKFLQQTDGISPIAPPASLSLKVVDGQSKLDKRSHRKQNIGFVSSTPLMRKAPKKRLLGQGDGIETVAEEDTSLRPKKRNFFNQVKRKEIVIDSNLENPSSKTLVGRRTSKRLQQSGTSDIAGPCFPSQKSSEMKSSQKKTHLQSEKYSTNSFSPPVGSSSRIKGRKRSYSQKLNDSMTQGKIANGVVKEELPHSTSSSLSRKTMVPPSKKQSTGIANRRPSKLGPSAVSARKVSKTSKQIKTMSKMAKTKKMTRGVRSRK